MTNSALPTNYGLEWNARAHAGEDVPPITHMAFGDGDRIPSGGETKLQNEVHRETISATGKLPDNTASFFDAPLPVGVGGFVTREVGLFTQNNKLVAIGRLDPSLSVNEAFDFTYQFIVAFSRLDALIVEVDPDHSITGNRRIDTEGGLDGGGDFSADRTLSTNWSNLIESIGIIRSHTLNLRQGTKQRKVTAGGLADWLVNETSRDTRSDDERLAKFNQLWINETVTYSVGVDADFETINDGMEFLKNRLIRDSATVTFALIAGVHTYDVDINITHPSARNIRLIAPPLLASAPVVADFQLTGNSAAARAADAANNLAMLRGKYATEVRLNGASLVGFSGIGLISNILFVGDGSSNFGLSLTDATYELGTISLHGFGDAQLFAISSRIIHSGNLTVTGGGQSGVVANFSNLMPDNNTRAIIAFGNAKDGVEINDNSELSNLSTHCRGNGSIGLNINVNAAANLTTAIASDAKDNGVHGVNMTSSKLRGNGFVATDNGNIGIASTSDSSAITPSATITGNAVGVFCFGRSYCDTDLSNVSGNATNFTPATNTVGNSNSFIRN